MITIAKKTTLHTLLKFIMMPKTLGTKNQRYIRLKSNLSGDEMIKNNLKNALNLLWIIYKGGEIHATINELFSLRK